MLTEIGNVLTQFISWVGEVISSLVTSGEALNPLLPLFCLGIGVSVFGIAFKWIKRITWGA